MPPHTKRLTWWGRHSCLPYLSFYFQPTFFFPLVLSLCLLPILAGCANRPPNPITDNVLFFVPGVAGDGPGYDGLLRGLRAGGVNDHLEIVGWGAPGPLFVFNFQNDAVHRGAEKKLAEQMHTWHERHPNGRINLIAHSAGCGVVLGALRLPDTPPPQTVLLLSPSVSPTYDLTASLDKIQGTLHVFHSDRDTFFLAWRTSTFGTYDNVKTRAAGNQGFDTQSLSPQLKSKIVQHARDDSWAAQMNDGSHFGATAEEFARQTLAPLLR
jgi:hypothetical protein